MLPHNSPPIQPLINPLTRNYYRSRPGRGPKYERRASSRPQNARRHTPISIEGGLALYEKIGEDVLLDTGDE
jgi:hypothetical protein